MTASGGEETTPKKPYKDFFQSFIMIEIDVPREFERYAEPLEEIQETLRVADAHYKDAISRKTDNGERVDLYIKSREAGSRALLVLNRLRTSILREFFDPEHRFKRPGYGELCGFAGSLGELGAEMRDIISGSDEYLRERKGGDWVRELNEEHPSFLDAWWQTLLYY
jgi:hypothetical protein